MYFSVEDDELLKYINGIWNKVSKSKKMSLIGNASIIKTFRKSK